jgi:hypothetical protein
MGLFFFNWIKAKNGKTGYINTLAVILEDPAKIDDYDNKRSNFKDT